MKGRILLQEMKERPLHSKQVQPLTQTKWPSANPGKHTSAKTYERYAIRVIIAISRSVECLHYIIKRLLFINCSQILDLVKEATGQPLQNTVVTITSHKCHKSWAENPQTQAHRPKYSVLIMYALKRPVCKMQHIQ